LRDFRARQPVLQIRIFFVKESRCRRTASRTIF